MVRILQGCGKVLEHDDRVILVAHQDEEADRVWRGIDNARRLTRGALETKRNYLVSSPIYCGWSNHFCTDLCVACAIKLGYLW
jgi:hypothetical protein